MRVVLAFLLGALGCGSSDVSREIGARCRAVADCDERCLPPSSEYPDGFCTTSCLSDRDCPGDAACIDEDGGVCLFTCVDDAGCSFLGTGWICDDEDRLGAEGETFVCIGVD